MGQSQKGQKSAYFSKYVYVLFSTVHRVLLYWRVKR